ncbi:MAG: hypothetical protein AAF557_06955 [Pseudomonadota bacterium]
MQRIEVREDTDNRFPWDTITFTYDLIGDQEVLRSTVRVFDDGLEQTRGFNIGSINNGTSPFTRQMDIPFFPDAVVRAEGYLDQGEDDGVKPWELYYSETITPGDSVLTSDGVITNPDGPETHFRAIVFDDGSADTRYWEDGVLRFVSVFDGVGGQTPWIRQEKSFDESGNLTRSVTPFDNGILRDERFTDGILTERRMSDGEFSSDNIKPWTEIVETYTVVGDESVLMSTTTTFDSGVILTEGVRLVDRIVGPTGFFSGDPPPPEIVQDVFRFRTWEDGDANGGPDTKPWTRIEETTFRPGDTLLTENGVITNPDFGSETTERMITYDSGDETFFRFTDGLLDIRISFDGPVVQSLSQPPGEGQGNKSWFAISNIYDANGALERKGTFFDNGIVRDDQFADGILTTRSLTDAFASGGDGVKPWSAIITDFDSTGVIARQQTFYDDGRRLNEFFEDGLLSQTVLTVPPVPPSQCSFTGDPDCPEIPVTVVSRVTDFDSSGERTQEVSTFSDRDVTGFIFTDGEITERQFYDGDDDEDWVVTRILFENGQRTEVITYDSLDLVPDDVIVVPEVVAPGPGTFM